MHERALRFHEFRFDSELARRIDDVDFSCTSDADELAAFESQASKFEQLSAEPKI